MDLKVNSYRVIYEGGITFVETTVFALSPEAAADMALDQIYEDLGLTTFPTFTWMLDSVTLLDEDVL